MDPIKIIQKYYKKDSEVYNILLEHSKAVSKKALGIAKNLTNLNVDLQFIEEAAMLHDIGLFLVNAPGIDCFGNNSYIWHGVLGREILEKEGFSKHALVCERHTGVGISLEDIEEQDLSLPKRDMLPISIEEEIICFTDCFFSKKLGELNKEKSVEEIKVRLGKFGIKKVKKFEEWMDRFLK